jgi:hypothetical protein
MDRHMLYIRVHMGHRQLVPDIRPLTLSLGRDEVQRHWFTGGGRPSGLRAALISIVKPDN